MSATGSSLPKMTPWTRLLRVAYVGLHVFVAISMYLVTPLLSDVGLAGFSDRLQGDPFRVVSLLWFAIWWLVPCLAGGIVVWKQANWFRNLPVTWFALATTAITLAIAGLSLIATLSPIYPLLEALHGREDDLVSDGQPIMFVQSFPHAGVWLVVIALVLGSLTVLGFLISLLRRPGLHSNEFRETGS